MQVRVMPRCWLVLLRFWLRVDKVLVRLRETRYFCDAGSAPTTVLREVKHSEGTFAELRAGGAPPEGVRLGCFPPFCRRIPRVITSACSARWQACLIRHGCPDLSACLCAA